MSSECQELAVLQQRLKIGVSHVGWVSSLCPAWKRWSHANTVRAHLIRAPVLVVEVQVTPLQLDNGSAIRLIWTCVSALKSYCGNHCTLACWGSQITCFITNGERRLLEVQVSFFCYSASGDSWEGQKKKKEKEKQSFGGTKLFRASKADVAMLSLYTTWEWSLCLHFVMSVW